MQIPELTFKPVTLSKENSKHVFHMILAARRGVETPLENSSLATEFLSQILLKRITAYGLPFKVTDMFFAASVMTFANNPGKIMALLRLCWQKWRDSGYTDFNINYWCNEMFPFGTPSDSDLQKWWDSQKSQGAPLDNLVDDASLWLIDR